MRERYRKSVSRLRWSRRRGSPVQPLQPAQQPLSPFFHPTPLQSHTMRSSSFLLAVLMLAAMLGPMQVMGGPAAYGICQSGCNVLAVACYAAAGVVMGVGSVPACNVALGVCMTACVAAGAAPTL